MRRLFAFSCDGQQLAASLDEAEGRTGLLIVSGGNEIRAGAHAGQARLAQAIAARGHPVLRFDPPGIGDSEGENRGFATRGPALLAAIGEFRRRAALDRLLLFGNCDAASLIALTGAPAGGWLLANPWVIEDERPIAAVAARRYAERLRHPVQALRDLASGRVQLAKLARGLGAIARPAPPSSLALRLGSALAEARVPVTILLARRDRTAQGFAAAWGSPAFAAARARCTLHELDSASHSFADEAADRWLEAQLLAALGSPPSAEPPSA